MMCVYRANKPSPLPTPHHPLPVSDFKCWQPDTYPKAGGRIVLSQETEFSINKQIVQSKWAGTFERSPMKNPPAPPPSNNTAWEAASHQAGSFTSASIFYSEMWTNSNKAADLKKKKAFNMKIKIKTRF